MQVAPGNQGIGKRNTVFVGSSLLAGGGLIYGASEWMKYLQKNICELIFDPNCVKGVCLAIAQDDCKKRFELLPVQSYVLGGLATVGFLITAIRLANKHFARERDEKLRLVGLVYGLGIICSGLVGSALALANQKDACFNTCYDLPNSGSYCYLEGRCFNWLTYECEKNCTNLSQVILSSCIPLFSGFAAGIPITYLNYKIAASSC